MIDMPHHMRSTRSISENDFYAQKVCRVIFANAAAAAGDDETSLKTK